MDYTNLTIFYTKLVSYIKTIFLAKNQKNQSISDTSEAVTFLQELEPAKLLSLSFNSLITEYHPGPCVEGA